jgi:hypothetical protein
LANEPEPEISNHVPLDASAEVFRTFVALVEFGMTRA